MSEIDAATPGSEDALIALFNSVYEQEWDRAADESDDRKKALMGAADEHATRMAVRAVVAAAVAPNSAQAAAHLRNPLLAYADSYRTMANIGDGRVSCLSVAYDIEKNMAPHATRATGGA